jgi:hypothetical protein
MNEICGAVYIGRTYPERRYESCVRAAGHERLRCGDFHWSAQGLSWVTKTARRAQPEGDAAPAPEGGAE